MSEQTPQSPAPVAGDEWTPWTGGPRPHPPATYVRVRYRDGTEDEGQSAFARWWHDEAEPDRDIIAFRLSRPASEQPVEAIGAGREEMQNAGFSVVLYSILGHPAGTWGFTSPFGARSKGFRSEDLAWEAARPVFLSERERAAKFFPASPARTPMGEQPVGKRLMDRTGLVHATTPGHPDAFLNVLLDYTAGFYTEARRAGMPASAVADAMNHVERAARGLHALAALSPASPARTPMGGEVEAPYGWVCYNIGPDAWYWSANREQLLHELSEDIRPATLLEKSILNVRGNKFEPYEEQALADSSPSPAQGGRPSDEQVRRAIQTRLHLHPTDETLGCLDRAVADIQALFAPPFVQPGEGK